MKIFFAAPLLALAALAPTSSVQAAESYDACTGTITALPAVIAGPGTWCVKQNLATAALSGNAITINANDVTLDCNGFKLDGTAAGAGTATKGVFASNRSGVTVRNCAVRGFTHGIALFGTGGGHLVERNRANANTYTGIWVEGDGSVVRDNQVTLTGGSSTTPHAYGIYSRYIVDIADNTVSGVTGPVGQSGNVIGIYTYGNVGGTLVGNRVHGLLKTGTLPVRGIFNYQSSRVVMARNNLTGDASTASVGMYCTNATSRAKDNVISGFVTALQSCGDAGRNDITP
jgi:hypothetical protein